MPNPWIVNRVPTPESSQVKLLKPIRLSIRDGETHIDPTTIRVVAGYAKVFSNADQFFDKELPLTRRTHLVQKRGGEPTLSLVANGVFIQQLGNLPERTLYTTTIEGGPGYKSVMLTAILRPQIATETSGGGGGLGGLGGPLGPSVYPGGLLPLPYSSGSGGGGGGADVGSGAVLALENGPRNKVVYLWFQNDETDGKIIRLTSYLTNDVDNPPAINLSEELDWDTYRRYTILWNEVEGFLEVYCDDEDGKDARVFNVAISAIPDMPADYYAKAGGAGSLTAMYGLMALAPADAVTISNVAFTSDVGHPVLGNIRPGSFVTQVVGAELVKTSGASDPREATVSAWMTAPAELLPNPDSTASGASSAGIFRMVKPTVDKTFALYREDPSLLDSDNNGFMVEARLHASSTVTQGAATGMGFTVSDGQNVFQVQLFKDPNFNTIGLLKKNGTDSDITEYYFPDEPFDWDGGRPFRLVMDPRREIICFYDSADLNTPIMEIPFDRALLPAVEDKDWENFHPFIMVGHTMGTTTAGTLSLYEIGLCHLYQAWDTNDAVLPTAADPAFTKTASGTPTDGLTSDGDFRIVAATGDLDKYRRVIEFGDHRGGIVEARIKIDSWRPFTRTGTYLILDDGLRAFALTFVENNVGKFVALSQRSGLGTFQEVVGRDGDAAKISFLLDWDQYHIYRMERHPFDGLKIFVDDETAPRISFPESKLAQLPDTQFMGVPTLGFGQFTTEGATSRWSFVRGLFSRGYDISFKKNKPDAVLRTELYRTQALIIAHAQDED